MTIQRKALGASTETLAERRQVRVVCSTADVDRSGDVVVQEGIDLSAYRANPVVLWQHDPEVPVARCVEIGLVGGRLSALVEFPEEGVSAKADEVYGLVKAGVVNATSVGFMPVDAEPIDAKNPKKGTRYKAVELMEFSFVSVPAARGALVVERSFSVEEIAPVLDLLREHGLVTTKGARAVTKVVPKNAPALTAKSLWLVGYLASAMGDLGWIQGYAADEAEWTGSESEVPGLLADALRQIGAALVEMTDESVAALLGRLADEGVGDAAADEADKAAPAITVKDVVGALRGKRIEALSLKAGKVLSGRNETDLTQARDLIQGVLDTANTETGDAAEEKAAARRKRVAEAMGLAVVA
jgi:HK97 family phage prohead protease